MKQPGKLRRAAGQTKLNLTPATAPDEPQAAVPPGLIAGIGASAGGVEALGRFFDAMPANSGVAFVVVLHLDPTRESQMASVLASHTAMPVVQVADKMRVEPGHVYVIAPDSDLSVRDGKLHLTEPAQSRGHRHPVDVLFRSLAADQGERAIAIVLSGTGANGTDGLRDVKAAGGLILIQDPVTAKFDGMPRSAISAGMADYILAPEAMPDVLVRYLRHDYIAAPADSGTAAPNAQALFDQILQLLRARAGHDFGSYKRSTLQRRIQRRLGLRNVATLAAYMDDLRANPEEVAQLVTDLMINVTGFFRDPDAWTALADLVIAPMIAARETGASIRAWVPACATGEEAYSLAMLLSEQAAAAGKQFDVSIFATDAREDNLSRGREGIYPQAALASLAAERQRRFFDRLDGTSQVKKELRNMVVFAPQNLLRDPPFSRLDLVSCRNLLIYLEPEAQQRAIALCHFALREGGHLLLGNTETVGRHEALFETVSKKWRIYRRLGPTRHDIVSFPVLGGSAQPRKTMEGTMPPPQAGPAVPAAEMARRVLLERFAPASVLIDRHCHVLYFHGPTGDYLEQPTGEPSTNLFAMARDGLAAKLRAAVREAIAENRGVTVSARVRQGGTNRPVTLVVTPLPAAVPGGGYLLVRFDPAPAAASPSGADAPEQVPNDHVLQDELKAARSELHATIASLETANEEMKASNEEITSMNEELQSTNEELETSKEEMQSFNEELHTVNNQLQHKVRELEDTTNDLNNLLAGNETATLFLDTNLCIKWFTPTTEELFDLRPSDIGRPIGHFAPKFADEKLLADVESVLRKLAVVEAEVPSKAGGWYLRRMLPYRTQDNRIAGVVITFIDVTERKHGADVVDEARIYAEAIVETIRQPLLILDGTLRVQSANRSFFDTFHVDERESVGNLVYELGNGQWDIPLLRTVLDDVLSKDVPITDFEVKHDFRDIGHRSMLLNARRLARKGGREALILLAIEDVTQRRRAEAHREILVRELNHRVKNTLATVNAIASQTLGGAKSLAEAQLAFQSRLLALARAHDLLIQGNFSGTDLASVIAAMIEPHEGGENRLRMEGPLVPLTAGTALSFSLALHELCTNAAKYGALSTPDGHVEIVWKVTGAAADRRLKLRWTESGGPPVTPPALKGFGSRLIEQALAMELGGEVCIHYEPAGVVCLIDAPLPLAHVEHYDVRWNG